MGPPKQKWTSEEEASLRAGVAKYGVGKWRAILKDPQFSSTLFCRSNVDLKDKWRNINFTAMPSGSREKGRTALKKIRSTPKNDDHAMVISTITSDINDEIVDEEPIAAVPSEALNTSNPKKTPSRLDNVIMEAIKTLNEPMGSNKTTIANYIEEHYWPSRDLDQLLSAKLMDLAASGKLKKVKRRYRIAPVSPLSDSRIPKMLQRQRLSWQKLRQQQEKQRLQKQKPKLHKPLRKQHF
ncbi:hypothetical protein QOZ80_3BG0269320 [Eleusine coracana subsp. coracana]|nr:hypothetical protein QOZ80_3BG0269320 [Eleusine coracana subsp. coracana]